MVLKLSSLSSVTTADEFTAIWSIVTQDWDDDMKKTFFFSAYRIIGLLLAQKAVRKYLPKGLKSISTAYKSI